MPRKDQASVTIPEWVWEKTKKYFEENKEVLKLQRVYSPSGLITKWAQDNLLQIALKEGHKLESSDQN